MRAWFDCTGAGLLRCEAEEIVGRLAAAQQRRGFAGIADQDGAWRRTIDALRTALAGAGGEAWTIALEFELTRLERRIDAVVITDRAILCCEFKTAEASRAALDQVEDYALRLRDFHAGSRLHTIAPLLVAGEGGFQAPAQPHLDLSGVLPVLRTGSAGLGAALRWVQDRTAPSGQALDGRRWLEAAYAPVPGIVEAARHLFARHDVVELGIARADAGNLTRTERAIARALAQARRGGSRVVVFVTGIPGAGKTLCGLNAVFRSDAKAAFLTGNAPLVAVLRAALARDAHDRGGDRKAAREKVEGFIQNVHRFLDQHAPSGPAPPEEVIVFDEAQRAWDAAQATRKSQNRTSKLTTSEPAHALDIMARRADWAGIVALIGNGQEINTGEAGLAEWGRAIAAHGGWRAVAAPRAVTATDPRQKLCDASAPWLAHDDALDLTVPIRAIRNSVVAEWTEAVLANDPSRASRLAASAPLPVFLTRDLDTLRLALRRLSRGTRRAGLLRSAGARRLRAEGLAAEVASDDVPNWFLNRWPDIRASDALEAAATEYACQGLELDLVGLAWDLDFRREGDGWAGYRLSGDRWMHERKEFDFVRNTYRVLLSRARYETVIWVPRGSARDEAWYDRTRDAAGYDAIAAFLGACGARAVTIAPTPTVAPAAAPLLL
jgi:hypothetical protein